MTDHAWGSNRILTHLPAGKELYKSLYLGNRKVKILPPRFISFWPAEICNCDCTYCFFSETNADKSHSYINPETFLRWLQEAKDAGAESCEMSGGGEPTLHPEFQRLYQTAYVMGYHLGLITHACNPMPLEDMSKHFKYIRCGLDAATVETHDAIKRNKRKGYWFYKAIENIKELVRLRDLKGTNDFTVGIKIVLNSINVHEITEMVKLARNLRVNYIQLKYEHSSDHTLTPEQLISAQGLLDYHMLRNEREFTQVKGTVEHSRATVKCFMSPIHTVVTATGKILQCCFFEDRPIGNISQPFAESWGSEAHREVIAKTTVQECDKVDCRWNGWNKIMKEVIEDPLASASFI